MFMKLSTFLGLKKAALNCLNFLSNRVLLSYKSLSYKKRMSQVYFSCTLLCLIVEGANYQGVDILKEKQETKLSCELKNNG